MILPLVHLNGTSARALLHQASAACAQLRVAILAMEDATPNGRDYYPLEVNDPGVTQRAIREHVARVEKLRSVLEDMSELADHILDNSRGAL